MKTYRLKDLFRFKACSLPTLDGVQQYNGPPAGPISLCPGLETIVLNMKICLTAPSSALMTTLWKCGTSGATKLHFLSWQVFSTTQFKTTFHDFSVFFRHVMKRRKTKHCTTACNLTYRVNRWHFLRDHKCLTYMLFTGHSDKVLCCDWSTSEVQMKPLIIWDYSLWWIIIFPGDC